MDIITYDFKREQLLKAIEIASRKLFFSPDREGMMDRNWAQRLDDKLMGTLAELSFVETMRNEGIACEVYDEIRNDDFKKWDAGWDVRFSCKGSWKTISVKSSRIPKEDTLETALDTRDFKIFAPEKRSIWRNGKKEELDADIDDWLKNDIEVQVYFDFQESELKENFRTVEVSNEVEELVKKLINLTPQEREEVCEALINLIGADQRWVKSYILRWRSKKNIRDVHKTLKDSEKFWMFYKKRYLKAPLKLGRPVAELFSIILTEC